MEGPRGGTRLHASDRGGDRHDGVVYVPVSSWEEARAADPQYPCCTFRGSVVALRISDGHQLWKTYLVEPARERGKTTTGVAAFGPSGVGVWSTPTVDARRGRLYAATADNYSVPATSLSDAVVALDLKTGHIVWSKQFTAGDVFSGACPSKAASCPDGPGPDYDFAASVILTTRAGSDVLLAGQKSGIVHALDPDKEAPFCGRRGSARAAPAAACSGAWPPTARHIYAATSDMDRKFQNRPARPAALRRRPQRGRRRHRAQDCRRHPGVVGGADSLHGRRAPRLQSGELGGGDGHSRRRVRLVQRRPRAGLCRVRRQGAVGLQHDARLRDRQWREGHGWLHRRPWRRRRRRHGVRQLRYSRNGGVPGNVLLAFAPRRSTARRCASCHDQINPRIPTKESLRKMPATRIVRALDTGAMMSIAFTMHRDERLAVASYLGTSDTVAGPKPSAYCTDRSIRLAASPAVAWNGWSPAPTTRASSRRRGPDSASSRSGISS